MVHDVCMYVCTYKHKYICVADSASPLTPNEIWKISNQIADIWKEIGLELGLNPQTLDTIELDHPNHNAKASLDMLFTWRKENIIASRSILNQVIKKYRTKKESRLLTSNRCIWEKYLISRLMNIK